MMFKCVYGNSHSIFKSSKSFYVFKATSVFPTLFYSPFFFLTVLFASISSYDSERFCQRTLFNILHNI